MADSARYDNKYLRLALVYAYDRESIVSIFLSGSATPMYTLVPYTTLFRSRLDESMMQMRTIRARHRLFINKPPHHSNQCIRYRYTQNKNRDNKRDRKSTRLNSSHVSISYGGFC